MNLSLTREHKSKISSNLATVSLSLSLEMEICIPHPIFTIKSIIINQVHPI